jgi:hypothetical protein
MNQIIRDYRSFRMLADQPRWKAFQNAVRAALGWKIAP